MGRAFTGSALARLRQKMPRKEGIFDLLRRHAGRHCSFLILAVSGLTENAHKRHEGCSPHGEPLPRVRKGETL